MKLLYRSLCQRKKMFNRTKLITSTITGDVNLILKCSCQAFFKCNELISNQYDLIQTNDVTKMKEMERETNNVPNPQACVVSVGTNNIVN